MSSQSRYPAQRQAKSTARSKAWRGRNQNQRPQRRYTDASAYVTKASLAGGRIRVPTNPPDVNFQPWNHVTLVDAFTHTDKEFKITDIVQLLKSQLDPINRGFNQGTGESALMVQMRFFEVMAWNLTGRMIAMSVTDFSESTSAKANREQLCGLVDTGAQSHIPAVGYLMPALHRSIVLRNDVVDRDVILFNIQAGQGDSCIFYLKMAYRFDGPVKIPKLMQPLAIMREQLEVTKSLNANTASVSDNTKKSTGTLSKLKNTLGDMVKKLPDTVQTIKDGVEVTAMLVSALALVEEEEQSRGGQTASPFEEIDPEMLALAVARM